MMAVLAIPMMNAQLDATKAGAMRSMDRSVITKSNPMKATQWGVRETAQMKRGTVMYLWDWEEEDSYEGWGAYDADGDGYSWGSTTDESYSGNWCLVSDSYISGGVGALDPDNWLISPDISLNGVLSIMAMNYSSYFADSFEVYVCVGELTSLDDFVSISGTCTPGSSWQEYTFDLTQFQGQTGCFAIRHYDSYNMYHLYIDDISIYIDEVADVPENLTVDTENITPTTADVTWDDATNAAWNLRYREVVPGLEENLLWDFEEDTFDNTDISLTGGWTSIDADGDGNDWYHLYGVAGLKSHSGTGHVTSASYNGDALDPDNWLVSPMVKLDGELSFWAASQDGNYPETFGVYVSTDMQNWEALEENLVAPSDMTEYTFDLTGYEGAEGYVAIRHYNSYDMFRLNIDDIAITYVEEPEWIYVENLDATEYTIEGLDPETTYEVQVQAINNDGLVSDWTPSTEFTTLEETEIQQTANPVITGEDGVDGNHAHLVTIEAEEGADIYYRYQKDGGEWTDWTLYDDVIVFTEDGEYNIEAYAIVPDFLPSEVEDYDFEITPRTAVNELNGGKTVAGVRYFNAIGQEMAQPNGMTIVVTTYTDGTTTAVKVMK